MTKLFPTGLLALVLSLPGGAVGAPPPLSFEQAAVLAADGPAVRLARGQLTLAQQQLGVASARVSGGLSAGYTRQAAVGADPADPVDEGGFDPVTAQLTLNFIPFGDAADAVNRAKWAVAGAEAALRDARADAVVGACTQYLTALRYSQEEAALAAAAGVAETALAATRARLEVGAANDADLLAAQIALSTARNELVEVALAREGALAALAQTLGVGVAAVSGEPPRVTLPELTDAEALLAGRSDLMTARLAVQEAELGRAAARRSVLPTGGVSAGYTASGVTFGAGLGTDTFQPSLSASYDPDGAGEDEGLSAQFSLSIPLDSGSGAVLEAAAVGVANAEQALEQAVALAGLELRAARAQLATTRRGLAAGRALVSQRRGSLAVTRTRLRLGLVAGYEVAAAEAALLAAQVDLARLRDGVLIAQLTLLQTLALDPLEVF